MAEDQPTISLDSAEFSFDQPWNPVSYFEEESEAVGSESCQYSPSKLESLFETNINAVDEDIARFKVAHNLTDEQNFQSFGAPNDIDDLNNFTLETENGIKVLDTTIELNRKAIFSDFDKLRRSKETAEKSNEDEEMFINELTGYLYQPKENENNMCSTSKKLVLSNDENNIDSIDFLLQSLPSVSPTFGTSPENTMEMAINKLVELETRLNDSDCLKTDNIANLQSPISDDGLCITGNSKDENNLLLPIEKDITNIAENSNLLEEVLKLPNIPENNSETNQASGDLNQCLLDFPNDEIIQATEIHTEPIDHVNSDCFSNKSSSGEIELEINDFNNKEREEFNTPKKEIFEDLDDSIENFINSDNTTEADALVEIATQIIVTPPTPNIDQPNINSTLRLTSDRKANIHEQCFESKSVDLADSVIKSNSCQLIGENKNDELINSIEERYDQQILPAIESENETIANMEETLGKEGKGSLIQDSPKKDIFQVNDEEDQKEAIIVNSIRSDSPNEPQTPQVSVTAFSETEYMKCLTLDKNREEENQENNPDSHDHTEVSTMTMSILDEDENDEDSKLDVCSPLPDVNFDIEVKPSILPSDSNDENMQLDSVFIPVKDSNKSINNELHAPVCFSADTSITDTELEQLVDDLENRNDTNTASISLETTESANSNSEIMEDTVSLPSHNFVEKSVVHAAVAATSDEANESVVDTISECQNNLEIPIDIVLPPTNTNIPTEGTVEPSDHEEANINQVTQANSTNELPDNAAANDPSTEIVDGAQCNGSELRTSLRRSGSTSGGSERRVRFSLDPQFEDDNNQNTTSQQQAGENISQEEGASQINANEGQSGEHNELINSSLVTTDQAIPETTPNQPITTSDSIPREVQNIGWVAPKWVPDEEASHCMKCEMKFTMVKRRHHCRACGKVLCSLCCNMKLLLPYLNYKSARVCQTCCDIIVSSAYQHSPSHPGGLTNNPDFATPQSNLTIPPHSQLPQAPPPYTETVDGGHSERFGSVSSEAPPYSEVSLSNSGSGSSRGAHYVEQPAPIMPAGAHSMDILPNGRPTFTGAQLSEMMSMQLPAYTPTSRSRQESRNRTESEMSAVIMFNSTVTNLPPILRRNNEETRIVNNPDMDTLFRQIYDEQEDPVSFIVNKNLVVRVKVINLDCCVEKKIWCFTSDGMGASNQEELVVLVKCDSYDIDDQTLARKVLSQMNAVFEKAKHGHPVSDLEQMEFQPSMCCMPKNEGMLFFKQSLQCVKKLLIPTSPYLFGMYVEKSEMAWAKNFPLRLLLRIGAEFKYYPCPLFNVLDRAPVYEGVGRTILDLLADFRNFQYTIPRVVGVTINLRGKDTVIRLPQHRYDEIMKAVNSCEENVLSLAGNFSSTCDGHLVSVEKDGRYKTQTLSIVLKANRKVTCASFIVISAALKINQDGVIAKASIVEDGVMVQVTSEVMKEFKQAVKDMKEYSVVSGDPNSDEASKVTIEWSSSDVMDRPRLLSPIDGTSFDNLTNMKIRHSYDYTSNNLTAKIHWVEVYFLPQDNDTVQRLSARELGQMTSSIAKACMSALSPHLMALIALEMTRIGLRVNLAADFVEYKIGSNLSTLPAELLPTLDDKLVPAIHNVMSSAQERVAVELIFQVVKIV